MPLEETNVPFVMSSPNDSREALRAEIAEPGARRAGFPARAVRKALPSRMPNRRRLSTDNRYQRRGEAIDPGALRTHYHL